MPRKMPRQKPRRSEQAVGTPPDFLAAVRERFGPIICDLAATKKNRVCSRWVGPGSEIPDFLALEDLPYNARRGIYWLNPPYEDLRSWAKQAAALARSRYVIAFLVPASVGSHWFKDYVHFMHRVIFLSPRLKFVGHKTGYPKDLMLVMFGHPPGYEYWRWKP